MCAGIYVSGFTTSNGVTSPQISIFAKYYEADPFLNWVNNNAAEPSGYDISSKWFLVGVEDTYSTPVTGAAGSNYKVWRF